MRIGAAALVSAVAIAIAAAASLPVSHALALGQTAQAFVCNYGGNSVTIYPAGSDGSNPANVTTLAGGETELESPAGIALAPDATPGLTKLYLTNCSQDCGGEGASSVNVYEFHIPADGGNVNSPAVGMI